MKQKTVKIISGILLAIAYISFTVAGFMDGLQEGLVIMGECTFVVLVAVLLIFVFPNTMMQVEIYKMKDRNENTK